MDNHEPTILIIDDSLDELRILVAMLRAEGYRVIIANSGKDGLVRAGYFKPQLILLDVTMPIMDGFAVCRRLKADQATRHIPVLFLTGACSVKDRVQGLEIGAADYISKPAVAEEVLLRIRVHLKNAATPALNDTVAVPEPTSVAPPPVSEPDTAAQTHWSDEVLVKVACSLMDEDLARYPGTERLAQMVGTHRRRLTQAFYNHFKMTVAEWHRERRLTEAAHLISATRLSLQAISDDLGFSSPSHFSTAFKDRYGVTPREYRSQDILHVPPIQFPLSSPSLDSMN